jgi:hypothetical protein
MDSWRRRHKGSTASSTTWETATGANDDHLRDLSLLARAPCWRPRVARSGVAAGVAVCVFSGVATSVAVASAFETGLFRRCGERARG